MLPKSFGSSFGAPTTKIEALHIDDDKDLPGAALVESQEKENEVFDFEKIYKSLFDKNNKFLVRKLSMVSSQYHNKIALKLIEVDCDSMVRTISSFRGLSYDVVLKLIQKNEVYFAKQHFIRQNLISFSRDDYSKIFLKLFEVNGDVVQDLFVFEDLSLDVALKLIEKGKGSFVAQTLSSFRDDDRSEIALKLIELNKNIDLRPFGSSVVKDLSWNVARRLIEKGKGVYVAEHFSSFKDINYSEVALNLIENGKEEYLEHNISSFKDLSQEVASQYEKKGKDDFIETHLSFFKELDMDIARRLIETRRGEYVARMLSSFKEANHIEIALSLLEKNRDGDVLHYFFNFTKNKQEKFLHALVEKKEFYFILICGSKFGKSLKDVPFLGDIYKMQPPSDNYDGDSWIRHLHPLLKNAFGEHDEALENKKAKNEVLKYIRNFGLVYVPYLFDIFRKIIDINEIDEETKKELRTFGINPNLQRDAILIELNKVANGYTKNILEGDIPDSLDTSLGKALFTKEFVPKSSFDRGYDNWKELGLKAQESYTVPSNIRKQEIELFEKGDMDEQESSVLQKKIQEVFENKETTTRFEVFKGYIQDVNNGFTIVDVQESVKKRIESQQDLITKKDSVKDIKVIGSIQKAIDKDLLLLKNLEEITIGIMDGGSFGNNSVMYTRLVDLSAERNNKDENLNRFLRAYVLTDILAVNPGLGALFNDMLTKDSVDAESLRILSDFASHSIDHEYLDRQENGFSEAVKLRIRTLLMADKIYKISSGKDGGDMGLDYFSKIVKDLEKIDNPTEGRVVSRVSFVPVSGLGRITAGNVGDACYTHQTDRLVRGDFQNTHMMMITKESKDGSEHIVGSLLGIQAQEYVSSVPVYVIRANNPQENYLSSIDVDSYVEASVQACIKQAVDIRNENISNGEHGDIKVCMPMDSNSSASMTNRPRVYERMYKKFSSCTKVRLNDNKDTNFNGYDIWNANGPHAVVCIYEIKDGIEYYHGKHREEKSHELIALEAFPRSDRMVKKVLRPRF